MRINQLFTAFLCLITFLCIVNSVSSKYGIKRRFIRKGKLYPPIGRLFKADLPTEENETNFVTKPTDEHRVISRLNDRNFHSGALEADPYKSLRNIEKSSKIIRRKTKHNPEKTKRVKRSKGIILGGEKFITDYYQDKTKRSDYEFKKKGAVRSDTKHNGKKRSKRNTESLPPKTLNEEIGKRSNNTAHSENSIIKHKNRTSDYTAMKKDYTQKLLLRKVEALFNLDANKDSGLKEDEIEKSKFLRKQLLNYYIKSKQRKNSIGVSSNHPKEEFGNQLTILQAVRVFTRVPLKESAASKELLCELQNVEDVNKLQVYVNGSLSRHVRMSIDLPVDDIEGIEELFEEYEESGVNKKVASDTEGRSRRRRLRRLAIPLLLVLKLKMLLLAPIIFSVVSLIAFKGLWAGMTALGVVSALALKSLFNNQVKIMYEMRPPHHYHHPPMGISEIQYHHGYPEYWSRREDSYKPIGGWSNEEPAIYDTPWPYSTINADHNLKSTAQSKSSSSTDTTDCTKKTTQA